MARGRGPKGPPDTALQKGRGSTQRKRLLAGMVAAANREGYAGATVSEVIAQAGVSRPTFYDYFEDRDACFVAAVLDVHERLFGEVLEKVAEGSPERALALAVEAIVGFAGSRPLEAQFLMKEALAGGPAALAARDEGITATAGLVADAFERVPAGALIPDLPLVGVVGAVHRLLATRLRRGERLLEGLLGDLLAWIESYAAPAGERRWRDASVVADVERSPFLPRTTLRPPQPLPPGRPRMAEEEVAENHRQRLMFATSQVVAEHGYAAATVTEITRVAGVDGRHFYRLFGEKQEAFSAIHELGFQNLMAVTAGAFFAGSSWPERIWEAFRAATQSVQENPAVARVGFVEAYAVGPRGIQRVEDSRVAFTIFLQEGYRYDAERVPPSRPALEAIITTIFEVVYQEARARAEPQTAGLLGQIVHLCLTPFMGAQAASEFIDAKLAAERTPGKPTARRKGAQARGKRQRGS